MNCVHAQAGGEASSSAVATTAACGECCVTTRWLGFYRVWQGSGEVFDAVDLFLPDVQFNTQARARCPPVPTRLL
jgi:DEAD/DEAH box helicase domain-containing protein